VYTSHAEHDIAYGAMRLVSPELKPASDLKVVEPLDIDLADFAARWRDHAARAKEAS
jgi:hypothetical protein